MTRASEQIIDEILVLDCQAGKTKALEMLVSRWQKRLWQHAHRLVGDVDAAWDVSQQSWLAIIKGLRKLREPEHFKAWAYRIVTNKAMDWISKRRRNQQVDIKPTQERDTGEPGEIDARALLEKLDLKKRVVLNLYYFEQLSVVEIGLALKIPPGTVKSRLFKAKQELRQLCKNTIDN